MTSPNPAERLVAELSKRSFLSLWTHPNPIGKNGKELCDCLIACGDDIIIISVKDIGYRDTQSAVGWERWRKAAIDASVQQIWGAERWLSRSDRVRRKDGREVQLPLASRRRFHRLSVSLGSRGEVPMRWGDLGHGFVHLLDEFSLIEAFRELDTVSDFVGYLRACEALYESGAKVLFDGGGQEDLLGLYVRRGPDFGLDSGATNAGRLLIVQAGIWKDLIASQEYRDRNFQLRSGYAWDRLIEHFVRDLLTEGMFDMHSQQVTTDELALVAMALQPRGHRAVLGEEFVKFLDPSCAAAARMIPAAHATAFVFLAGDTEDREHRTRELGLRCLVVRGRCPGITTVVGIATDRPRPGKHGHSSDLVYIRVTEWTEQDAANVSAMQSELGYFKNTRWS